MTCRMYAYTGLLTRRNRIAQASMTVGRDSQSVAVFAWLGRNIKRYPALWLLKCNNPHVLKIAWPRSGTYCEGRGGVRIVLGVAQMYADFLETRLDEERRVTTMRQRIPVSLLFAETRL